MSDARKNPPPKGAGAKPSTPAPTSDPATDADAPPTSVPPAWAKASVAWPFKAAPSLTQRSRRKP